MKKMYYLIPAILLVSCQAGKYVYDDVYDQAENPFTAEEQNGYADYIKGNEKEHKVVIDEPVQQNNSAYYGDIDNNCDCRRNYNSPFKYRWGTDYIYFGSYQPFSSNDCPCYYNMNNCGYSQNQNSYYSPYGYFDHLGVWHGYHPWMFNPYNGYFYSYGDPYYMSSYYWNNNYYNGFYGYYGNSNNNLGWWYNNNQNWSSGSGNTSSSNVIYGHRGNNFAGSPNTTAYDHTVKNSNNNNNDNTDDVELSNGDHQDTYGRNIGGTSSTDMFIDPVNNETPVVSPAKNIKENGGTINAGSDISANTATNTVSDQVDNSDRVIATNPFDPTGVNSRNSGESTQQEAKTNSSSSNTQTRYTYTSDDDTNAESDRSTNGTSRQETEQRTYNTNQQRDNNSSGNSYGGHRTSTTTTSSGGSNSSSGSGGRTTTTSRR
ncbi:MAG: hypothetical protein IPM74_06450 [Crocinitomicaceae bacterium]|nr:hypothetical protein [Crocinitomicaceae bacterium]MBK8925542.1 hypothetical protein [Crocinitomicaceae bacterium]